MLVTLTENERHVLMTSVLLPETLRSVVNSARQSGRNWTLEISDDDANEVRDLCGDRLQEVGFDERYEPNEAGLLLEQLVDKFFTG